MALICNYGHDHAAKGEWSSCQASSSHLFSSESLESHRGIEEAWPPTIRPSSSDRRQQRQQQQRQLDPEEHEESHTPQTSSSAESPAALHVISHSDRFGTFFTSAWNSSFLLTVAPPGPWRGSEVYVEVPSPGGRLTHTSIATIAIDPPSGHKLVRIEGPVPFWYHSRPSVIASTNDGATASSTSVLPSPPEDTYSSGELAVASAQRFALEHGYKLVIANSAIVEGGHRRWYLRCHESGAGRVAKVQKGKAVENGDEGGDVGGDSGCAHDSARVTGCKFSITIRPLNGRWQLQITHPSHNGHGKDVSLLTTESQKLTQSERLVIGRLHQQDPRIKPAKILEMLNQKREELGKPPFTSRTPVTQYLHHLRTYRRTSDARGQLTTMRGRSLLQDDSTTLPCNTLASSSSTTSVPCSSTSSAIPSLDARCAQDFQQSIFQHLGCPLPCLPPEHEARIKAAAQLYLSSTSLAYDGDQSIRATAWTSSTMDAVGLRGDEAQRRRRCKLCQQLGHNRRTCPQRRITAVPSQRAGEGN